MDDEQSKDGLENAITAYYGAAADGDYQYTYDNLVSEDRAQLSVDEGSRPTKP